jgi:hypothetical protein
MSLSREMVALMRENAALCTLEAEIILALKYLEVRQEDLARGQLSKIQESLHVIDTVRKRNNEVKGMYDGEDS